jgi:hypothetical protein
MPRFQRPRHEVAPIVTIMARPLFRYSRTRDAYVLRGVGNRVGPVLRTRGRGGRFERSALSE